MEPSSRSMINEKFGSLSIQESLLFLFWPFAALIYGLKQYKSPRAMTLFWFFCIYFGFSFIIPENVPGAPDSARHAATLQILHDEPISFNQLTATLFSEKGLLDIYEPIVAWLVSLFTGNASVLFAVYAAVFGFFYAKNTWMILARVNKIDSVLLLLFIIGFVLINPIWQINGVRMWTAAQIFIYGTLRIFLEEKKSGWFWVGTSIFVHFSFAFPVALLILFNFLPLNLALLVLFYFFTLLISEIDLKVVKNILIALPDVLHNKINSYTNQDYAEVIEIRKNNYSWHIFIAEMSLKWVKLTWILLLFVFRKQWVSGNPILVKIFGLALFIGGFANVTSLIPSGGRFMLLANVLFFATFVMLFARGYFENLRTIKWITVPFLTFSIAFSLRLGADFTGFTAILGNPLIAVFIDKQMPLIDFVKWLF